ncbi:MAG: membrane protein insertase YidC [Hyphomicrobiaceae bacterium]
MHPQQPEDKKNLLIAIVLSMGVLFGWQAFYAGPKEQERQRQQKAQPAPPPGAAVPGGQAPSVELPGAKAPAAPGGAVAAAALTREQALKIAPRVAVDTPSLRGFVNLKGGRIDALELKKYRETVDPASPNIVLFSPAETPNAYFAEHGWVPASGSPPLDLPGSDTLWQVEKAGTLTPESPVRLVWDNGQGLLFRRTVSVDEHYMFTIADEVENKTSAAVTLHSYARLYRYGTPPIQGFFILHEGLIGMVGAAGLQELTYSSVLDGGRIIEKATAGWLGITDKYWAAILVPPQNEPYRAQFDGTKKTAAAKEDYKVNYLLNPVTVPAGGKIGVENRVFAGAKQVGLVKGYGDNLHIYKFEYIIDWGWFFFITKPLFSLMSWLYGLVGNFGIVILIVTVLVKLAFFPLANKSYVSMAKMKKLQPEMERIRDRHKDDRARQQQEFMALYQKEKINPLAGCLPILLQIPVFFALYKVLFVTIDMRHAPFFGWIKDLSAADPTSIFNLFGLLPYSVPEFLLIGVWPIVMGVTMWLQMQLNPQNPDPIQQQIFNWMPVFFTFLLGSFPAGLVIYWAWNNILSLAQQWVIMRRQGVDVPLVANLQRAFTPVADLARRRFASASSKPEGSAAGKAADGKARTDGKAAEPSAGAAKVSHTPDTKANGSAKDRNKPSKEKRTG